MYKTWCDYVKPKYDEKVWPKYDEKLFDMDTNMVALYIKTDGI